MVNPKPGTQRAAILIGPDAHGAEISNIGAFGFDHAIEVQGARNASITDVFAVAPALPEVPQHQTSASPKHWYERPVGIVTLGVLVALLGTAAIAGISHFAPWIAP